MSTATAPAARRCIRAPRSLADVKVTYTYVEMTEQQEQAARRMMLDLFRRNAANPRTSHA